MLNRLGRLFAAAAIGVFLNISPASAAQETGFSGLHAQMRVGNRTCYSSHVHHGTASGATRKVAIHDAIASWNSFTAWEYGNAWAKFTRAIAKSSDCSRRGARTWRCNVKARPCQISRARHAGRVSARAKRIRRQIMRRKARHRARRHRR